ncbi:MAG TPA: hypothetical protein V6C71_17755 [Coleofasciculaceae cyanobacterium]|jgi:hypothetical protein
MKKSTLGILTAIIAFAPLTAFAQQLGSTSSGNPSVAQAQDAQTSIQNNTNSGAAVGTSNFIHQNTDQTNYQNQLDLGGYSTPDAQTSVQLNANEAAGVGHGNAIIQDANQTNVQGQVDVNQYLPYGH